MQRFDQQTPGVRLVQADHARHATVTRHDDIVGGIGLDRARKGHGSPSARGSR